MTQVTSVYTTSSAVGIREDLSDQIFRVDVDDTPFMSMVGSTKAKQTLHEWQTRALNAVNTSNAHSEGEQTSRAASTNNVRLSNVCQISEKDATTSGTLEAVDKAGRASEMALQMADRTIELRKDMEYALTSNQAFSNSDPRNLRGFEAWIRTNTSRGAGGSNPADPTVTPATTATDGTQRTFTETLFLTVAQSIFTSGGNLKFALMSPGQKVTASNFTGRASAREITKERRIQQAANLYASDFGDIKMVPHRYFRGRTCLMVDPENVSVAYLRKFVRFPLAKIGDAETRVILSEYTLEMRNEKAHGVIADLL